MKPSDSPAMPADPGSDETIFAAALQWEIPAQRAAYLDEACADNPALRARVEELLRAGEAAPTFLERPVGVPRPLAGGTAPTVKVGFSELLPAAEGPGTRVGRYKLLQQIGEGGCGTVFMAEQEEPVRRRVALKVIKLGMDTKSVVARFEAERQALAMMDHPNIAKVLDAGATDSGRPFFVMELVRGIPITRYCDENKLDTQQRLDLFIRVCHAIQHAHQKGIIHRDIKPSNILVTLHDGTPVPKVIDFGIAKATEGRLTNATLFTAFEQFIGTPAYMSPEQAEMSGLDIDTRSDIYALGVLLYELLTGKTPFDAKELAQSGLDAMRRTIREKEPVRPSTRLSTMLGDALTATAVSHGSDAVKLLKLIRGDLDWIVMKCLEKDRTRRYETANGLAADLKRHLHNEPVVARPPSTGYRLQKAYRRNRLAFVAALAVSLAVLFGLAVSAWQAIRATRAERLATDRLAEVARERDAKEKSRQEAEASREAAQQAKASESALRQQADELARVSRARAYASDLNLASQALAQDNLARARKLLDRQVPGAGETDLRGWEWRYLWAQSQPDPHESIYTNRNGRISSLDISADGNHVGLETRFIQLMDLATKSLTPVGGELPRGSASHVGLAFAHRAPWVAYSRADGTNFTLHIHDWQAKKNVMPPQDTAGFLPRWMVFTPDDRVVVTLGFLPLRSQATRSDDNRVRLGVRVVATGEEIWAKDLHMFGGGGWMRRLDVSSDGTEVAVTVLDGRVQVLRLRDGSERLNLKVTDEIAMGVRFSPDGRTLATAAGYGDPHIRLWDLADGRELGRLEGHQAFVTGLAFTPDGRQLVSSSGDYTIRVWDLASRRMISTLRGHQDEVDGLALSPDGRTIISRCKDGTVFRWRMPDPDDRRGYRTVQMDLADSEITSLRFHSDGQTLMAERPSLPPLRLDLVGLRVTSNSLTADRPVLVWTPDGERFVATLEGDNEHLGVFEARSRKQVATIPWRTEDALGNPLSPGSFRFLDGGKWLVRRIRPQRIPPTMPFFDTVEWYSTANWQREGQMAVGEDGFPARTLPCEQGWLPVVRNAGYEVFDLAVTNPVGIHFPKPRGSSFVEGFVAAPDRNYAASADQGGTVWVWDWNTRELNHRFKAFRLGAHSIVRSSDGRRLAVGSNRDEAVKLWDTESWEEVLTLQGEGSLFESATFSPDGRHLAAANGKGLVHLWTAPTMEEITALQAKARKEAGRP